MKASFSTSTIRVLDNGNSHPCYHHGDRHFHSLRRAGGEQMLPRKNGNYRPLTILLLHFFLLLEKCKHGLKFCYVTSGAIVSVCGLIESPPRQI